MNDTYPVGLACTAIELHEYPIGVRIRPFTITPPEPSQIYTFFVYHQPFREPQLSFRDVRPARRHRGTDPVTGERAGRIISARKATLRERAIYEEK
jgi:hypothetical protein